VSLDFGTRVPLAGGERGRQNDELPRSDGEFLQPDLHAEQTVEHQVELVECVRVQAWTGCPSAGLRHR